MTDEQRRRGPAATQIEATGEHVRRNVKRLREIRGLTTYDLAKILADNGRPIPRSGISRIESGARRVDVDDLTALAVALAVNPSTLLLPPNATSGPHDVEITGGGTVPGWLAWGWADGINPLVIPERDPDGSKWLDFRLTARPRGWGGRQNVGISRGLRQLSKALDDHFGNDYLPEERGSDDG